MKDLTFSNAAKILKDSDGALLETVDTVLGPGIVLAGLAGELCGLTGSSAAANALLRPKTALVNAGRRLVRLVAKQKFPSETARVQRMHAAYTLTVWTGFYDALVKSIGKLDKSLGLTSNEKWTLAENALDELIACDGEGPGTGLEGRGGGVLVPMPHPVDGLATQKRRLQPLYSSLARGYRRFLPALAAWEEADKEVRSTVEQALAELPEKAVKRFEAQFIDLASRFPAFFVWAQLHQLSGASKKLDSLAEDWRLLAKQAADASVKIDVGFVELRRAVAAIPAAQAAEVATRAIADLTKQYSAFANDAIIDDGIQDGEECDGPGLAYPRRQDAFVPQAFRVIRTTAKERLEDERTWRDIDVRDDLTSFLVGFFRSPYSTEGPLLLLGDPGSGKSLLTHMLAAGLAGTAFSPIRIALRAIGAEVVSQQIEEQIEADTNGRKASWPDLSEALSAAPPLLMFDGYDELLQASGKVHGGYLRSVQQFQQRERNLGRPVAAMVTSRITLVDMCTVPSGTTVVRLEPFDERRREEWSKVWNGTNKPYFSATGTKLFRVPKDKKIVELARQPLLLLMLALYDAHGNPLATSKGLDRTGLYERLLRQFIERERMKAPDFRDMGQAKRNDLVEADLERLGVVAVSMFNRRSLLVRPSQLNQDIAFFKREVAQELGGEGHALSQADLILGRFFFVHESRSSAPGTVDAATRSNSAFQFLHNTFGEFLVARFIVSRAVDATAWVSALSQMATTDNLRLQLDRQLASADGPGPEWYGCLLFTPVFSRPVVLQMIREWLPHAARSRKLDAETFLNALSRIVREELRKIMGHGPLPVHVLQPPPASFASLPVVGHLATYTSNVVLLRVACADAPVTFAELGIAETKSVGATWEQIAGLWRAWFGVDQLGQLAGSLTPNLREGTLALDIDPTGEQKPTTDRLSQIRDTSHAIGDRLLFCLSALARLDASETSLDSLDAVSTSAAEESLSVEPLLARVRLLHAIVGTHPEPRMKTRGRRRRPEPDHRSHLRRAFAGARLRPGLAHRRDVVRSETLRRSPRPGRKEEDPCCGAPIAPRERAENRHWSRPRRRSRLRERCTPA